MTSNNKTSNMAWLNTHFAKFIENCESLEDAQNKWTDSENQRELRFLFIEFVPKPTRKRKRKRKKKGEWSPKSAYLHFCAAERPKIKEDSPSISGKDIMRELGKRWRVVRDAGDGRVDKYKKAAEEDKKRALQEKNESSSDSENMPEKTKKASRPKSAYLLFCAEERPKIKEESPGKNGKEIMRELGKRWRKAKSEGSVEKFQSQAREAKEIFDKKNSVEVEVEQETQHFGYSTILPDDDDDVCVECCEEDEPAVEKKPVFVSESGRVYAQRFYGWTCRDAISGDLDTDDMKKVRKEIKRRWGEFNKAKKAEWRARCLEEVE